jgi:hypothetical protein
MNYSEAIRELKRPKNNSPRTEYILKVATTQRSRGAVGKNPLVVQYVRDHAEFDDFILDFGCGYYGSHVYRLREKEGFQNVYGYDVLVDPCHTLLSSGMCVTMDHDWDWIMVSNVINVQPTVSHVFQVVEEIRSLSTIGTTVVLNYPQSPRKHNMRDDELQRELQMKGFVVETVRTGSGKLYICKVEM